MAEQSKPRVGTFAWMEHHSARQAEAVEFYQHVVGWGSQGEEVTGCADFNVTLPATGEVVAGVCHVPQEPACWMPYVVVEHLENALARATDRGGKVVDGPRDGGTYGRWATIQDPLGARLCLWQTNP